MAAKRKIAPPKPDPNRPWSELTKAEQSAHYSQALQAYAQGKGPNPRTLGEFTKAKASA
jgi:hypothetical protein